MNILTGMKTTNIHKEKSCLNFNHDHSHFLIDKDALIEEQQVRIKKTELMLAEKEELIKGLKRELELALEQFSSSKKQRVAD